MRRFKFLPAKIVEPDIGKRPTDAIYQNECLITDEAAFDLLRSFLLQTPLVKIYKALDEGIIAF